MGIDHGEKPKKKKKVVRVPLKKPKVMNKKNTKTSITDAQKRTQTKKMSAKEIFSEYRNKNQDAINFINKYKDYLSRSLVIIITTIDPDAIVFGGGVSNEIDFLDELKLRTSKYLNEKNLKTVFLKPIYGDASGVRGAALLGRQNLT